MTFEFRDDREAHLRMVCEEMGKTPNEFINEAVIAFVEDPKSTNTSSGL